MRQRYWWNQDTVEFPTTFPVYNITCY